MKKTYIAILGVFILLSVVLVNWNPWAKKEPSSILQDQAAVLEPFLLPDAKPAEVAVSCAQNVPAPIHPAPSVPQSITPPPAMLPPTTAPSVTVPPPIAPVATVTAPAPQQQPVAAPVSYIYFYTGVPVRPAQATNTIVYTTGYTTTGVIPTVPMPVAQSFVVPVFVPQVVQSRVGAPKLVYSNGVVIKPKVYFPNQPVKNTLRFVAP